MKKPSLTALMDKYNGTDLTRYSLVIAISKRARNIQEYSEQNGTHLTERPVILATDDLYNDRVKIVE